VSGMIVRPPFPPGMPFGLVQGGDAQ